MNKKLFDELTEALVFNKNDLDEAILHHSELFFAVSEEYVKSCSIRDFNKKEIEEAYAKSSLRLREQLAEEGKKATEDIVKQLTLIDEEYKDSISTYLDSKLDADLWGALKEAFSSRGYMIREVAELWRASYFSTSAITQPNQTAGEIQYEATRALIGEKRALKHR